MQQTGYRFVEACALLPMLFVPPNRDNTVFCTGAQAETLAADCLRWRDVTCVYLTSPPIRAVLPDPVKHPTLKDKRLVITPTPPIGSCSAVLTTPGEDPDQYLQALRADGVICASRYGIGDFSTLLGHMRRLFPKSVIPWREYLPAELYGTLASPKGVPTRYRKPPGASKRLNDAHIRCLMSFAQDELPVVFGSSSAKTDSIAKKG